MNDIFDLMITEIIQEELQRLRNEHSEYDETIRNKAELSGIIYNFLDNILTPVEIEQCERYRKLDFNASAIELSHVYLRGMRDCYKLLNRLQI